MISEDEYNLRPIWDATFSIYKEIERICDRHGPRYCDIVAQSGIRAGKVG